MPSASPFSSSSSPDLPPPEPCSPRAGWTVDVDGLPVDDTLPDASHSVYVQTTEHLRSTTTLTLSLLARSHDLRDLRPVPVTTIDGAVNGLPVSIIIDSGCGHVILSLSLAQRLTLDLVKSDCDVLTAGPGPPAKAWLTPSIRLQLGPLTFLTSALVLDSPHFDVLLGQSWLHRTKAILNYEQHSLSVHGHCIPLSLHSLSPTPAPRTSAMLTAQFRASCTHPTGRLPSEPCLGPAGWFVHAAESLVLAPRELRRVPTGILLETPPNSYVMIGACAALSSMGVDVVECVADRGCRAPLSIAIRNNSRVPYLVRAGARLARLSLESFGDVADITPVHGLADLGRPSLLTGTAPIASNHPVVRSLLAEAAVAAPPSEVESTLSYLEPFIGTTVAAERAATLLLLREFIDLFDRQASVTTAGEFSFSTGDAKPIARPPFRTSPEEDKVMQEHLQEMLDADVIEPSRSPWGAPAMFIRKKDGSLRFVIDYRLLNAVSEPDPFPMPRIDETLDRLEGARFFTTLDLKAGYWQVPVHPDTREKTAFVTKYQTYQFKVMPFGHRNAPAVFSRMMADLFPVHEFPFVLVYLDDVNIFSRSFDEHLVHVRRVFERFQSVNLRLNRKKCRFATLETKYLGFKVNQLGTLPDDTRVAALRETKLPRNTTQLKAFLGAFNSYRKFVPRSAGVCEPLYRLLRKGAEWRWTDEHTRAIDAIKDALTTAPVLIHPDFEQPFVLETDASQVGLGACLSQERDGQLRPICYASRTLHPAERNYSVTERECLAVVFGAKEFRTYLMGPYPFRLLVDHAPLVALHGARDPTSRLARWASYLQMFNFRTEYRPGPQNVMADLLSRLPMQSFTELSEARQALRIYAEADISPDIRDAATRLLERIDRELTMPRTTTVLMISLEVLAVQTRRQAAAARDAALASRPPGADANTAPDAPASATNDADTAAMTTPPETITPSDADAATTLSTSDAAAGDTHTATATAPPPTNVVIDWNHERSWELAALALRTGVIPSELGAAPRVRRALRKYRWAHGAVRLLRRHARWTTVPRPSVRTTILHDFHDRIAAHGGVEATHQLLTARYSWPGLFSDLQRFVRACTHCQRFQQSRAQPPLQQFNVPTRPFQRLAMDFVGPFGYSDRRPQYIVFAVDLLTRWVEAQVVTEQTAKAAATFLFDYVVTRFGVPHEILTDNGTHFANTTFHHIYEILGIQRAAIAARAPQANAVAERANKTFSQKIKVLRDQRLQDLPSLLNIALMATRATRHETTGFSPAMLLLGYELRLPLADDPPSIPPDALDYQRYAAQLATVRPYHWNLAARRTRLMFERAKRILARGHPPLPTSYKVGDLVFYRLLQDQPMHPRLEPRWLGPARIIAKSTYDMYDIQNLVSQAIVRHIGVRRIKPCFIYARDRAALQPDARHPGE